MARPVVLFLHGASWEARYQATTLSLTAAALGDEVHLALFFGALRAWIDGRFDEGAPATAAPARVAPLKASLDEARRDLGVRVVACDTAVRLAGLAPAAVAASLDGVVSLVELWRLARSGQAIVI